MDSIRPYAEKLSKLYKTNKYFRIISITTVSLSGLWLARNAYLKLWRKAKGLPNGPYGIPILGNAIDFLDVFWLVSLKKYGPVVHLTMGPTVSILTLNDSNLIKKIYKDPRTTDVSEAFSGNTDVMFISTNGKEWETRRRIVYANLMSTLKASFVEEAAKNFIKNKVFPVFNAKIKSNESIKVKPLLLST